MKIVLIPALAGLIALAPLAAQAHGPVRKKVTETIVIDQPPAKVWAAVGNFGDMSWLAPVAKTEAKGGNTVVDEDDDAKNPTRRLTLSWSRRFSRMCTGPDTMPYRRARRPGPYAFSTGATIGVFCRRSPDADGWPAHRRSSPS